MNELLRRAILILCLGIAAGLVRYAELGEYMLIHRITESSIRSGGLRMWGMSGAEKERLKTLPLRDLVQEQQHASLIIVKGGQLKSFYKQALKAFETGGHVPDKWKKGAVYSVGDLSALWLRAERFPLNELESEYLGSDLDQVVLAASESDTKLLRVRRRDITAGSYSFMGFSGDTPPFLLLYPYCWQALYLALAGILFYLFVPWTKPIPDSLYTRRWQVMFMDFAALWLFLPFFLLGWFFAGPTSIAPGSMWLIGALMWALSMGGLYLLEQGAFYALFNLKSEDDGLRIRTFEGEFKLPYDDIEKVQGAILKNPRWLTVLLTLASIFGKGSQRFLAGGQALTMGSASYPGMALTLKKGGTVYLWGSASGNTFAHMQKFHDGLQSAGVELGEKPLEVRGFGTEPKFNAFADLECGWMLRHPVRVMIAAPFIGVLAVCAAALF